MFSSALHKTGKFLRIKSQSDPPLAEESATGYSSSNDSEDSKSQSIKAFRTITTMLAAIPTQRVINVADRKPGNAAEDKELKLLNSLATLLVRNNEVAAVVVTEHNNGSGAIQVIACHHIISGHGAGPELTIPISQPASSSHPTPGPFRNFLATLNPRKDAPSYMADSVHPGPSIIDPKVKIPSKIRETNDIDKISTYRYDMW